jgi:hypothetical protein
VRVKKWDWTNHPIDLAQAVYTKMLPMLFSDFEWSYTDPEAEKKTQCTFSVRYMNLMMQWKERSKAE